MIAIEYRKAQILDVHADPIAHDKHQDHRSQQRQRRTYRIAAQLQRFAAAVAEQPLQTEGLARGRAFWMGCCSRRKFLRNCGGWLRLLEPGDKRLFEAGGTALFDQRLRRIAGQYLAGVHQRDAVAAFRLIHKVGGDKNGHPILTREVDHQLPEHIPCHWIDPGGGFVEDQHFRAMDDRHRQRQTLTDAQRQGGGQGVFHLAEHEALAHFRHPTGDFAVRNMKQAGVQFEVLPDGQFAIEREGLRHIAHPLAGGDILRIDRLAEQPGFAFAGGQQAGEHLHGGGFAAAVGAEEAEDFTARDAEVNVVDGDEVAKAHGQPTGFDGDLFLAVVARRDHHRLMRLALRFR